MPSVAAIVLPSLAVLLKGIFARTLYTVHGFLCVWRLTDVKSDPTYWLATVPVLLLPIEMVITVAVNKTKGEWKWFCPSVFLCLATSVSAIYILEIELMNQRIDYTETKNLTSCDVESGDVHTNSTRLSDIHGLRIPLSLRDDYWVLALEQFLVCMIIVGRWFLPKGDMTREQLSTLLLVYIGIASTSWSLYGRDSRNRR
ncbi:transmembrane protein 26-like [Ptychodera flava]|uniref:transmembrane protein 26-like n=1 Tax=Ptychodera flava TaxID=63121 RepID=UPI00396A7B3C